jgi:hypothetical protein
MAQANRVSVMNPCVSSGQKVRAGRSVMTRTGDIARYVTLINKGRQCGTHTSRRVQAVFALELEQS